MVLIIRTYKRTNRIKEFEQQIPHSIIWKTCSGSSMLKVGERDLACNTEMRVRYNF